MKKTALALTFLVSIMAMSFAIGKDDPKYKNLKILPKNITKAQMDSVMHHFSMSLNVKCNFCHVRTDSTKTWDFASDANKHKLAAREMMTMTQKINDKYFEVTNTKSLNAKLMVTCYTCHHGSPDPSTQPPHREEKQTPRPAVDSTRKQ